MDIAVLVRAALLRRKTGAVAPVARVPATTRWPSRDQWATAGMLVRTEGDALTVGPERWTPPWLERSADYEPGLAAAREEPRREPPLAAMPADPFFQSATGFRTYSAPAQREAVRAVALAAPGATVIVSLPTGTGKSAVAYSPAVLAARRGAGSAVVVVPTTALALDQQRAYQEMAAENKVGAPSVLAYHGELPDDAKRELRARIRTGQQQIVFASPEALLGGLRPALFDAARAGLISLFAVDEAHMAVSWGEEFRTDFQMLNQLRDALLGLCSNDSTQFVTLLMSGTLTAPVIERLTQDFGTDGAVEFVSGAALRPEPEYWIAESTDEPERSARVLEALAHLPRPAILYTTRPADAEQWGAHLYAGGFRRFTIVHGGTSDRARLRAIHGMRGTTETGSPARTRFDLVVGTSAYGLGLDQPDVRTIVHACLPESLDRFYQEVGRSGRDGKGSVSVLIPARGDMSIARGLSEDTIIGIKKARERWRAMTANSRQADDGSRRIRLAQIPAYLPRENDTITAWNLRTLLLLQRSGRVRLALEAPPRRDEGESDEAWDQRSERAWRQQSETRIVHVIRPLLSEAHWAEVQDTRVQKQEVGRRGFEALREAINEDTSHGLCAAFAAEYGISRHAIPSLPSVQVKVVKACGGCPECRRLGRAPNPGYLPDPGPPRVADRAAANIGQLITDPSGALIVLVDDPDSRGTVRRLRSELRRLIEGGVCAVVAPRDTLKALFDVAAVRPVINATEWDPTALPELTCAVVALNADTSELADMLRFGPRRLVFAVREASDPDFSHGTLAGRPNTVALTDLALRLDGGA